MEWNKNKDRNEKIKELLSEGNTITHVAEIVGCSKGTVHYYAKKHGWWHNDEVKKERRKNISRSCKVASAVNKKHWFNKRLEIIKQAKEEWYQIKSDPQYNLFLGLYWGEGNKRNGSVGVVNNDPGIIKFCYDFIKKNTDNSIEVIIRCYPEQNHNECGAFWEELLKTKIRIKEKKWLGKTRRCWSENGICTIRTSDWKFYLKIITWIGLWRSEITGTKLEIDPNESISKSGLYSTIEYE